MSRIDHGNEVSRARSQPFELISYAQNCVFHLRTDKAYRLATRDEIDTGHMTERVYCIGAHAGQRQMRFKFHGAKILRKKIRRFARNDSERWDDKGARSKYSPCMHGYQGLSFLCYVIVFC
jgi:hypothetical protein